MLLLLHAFSFWRCYRKLAKHAMVKYSTRPQSKMTKTSRQCPSCRNELMPRAFILLTYILFSAGLLIWLRSKIHFDIRAENGQRGASSQIFNVLWRKTRHFTQHTVSSFPSFRFMLVKISSRGSPVVKCKSGKIKLTCIFWTSLAVFDNDCLSNHG